METVEILAGGKFANAVESLCLTSAKCTYRYLPPPESYRESYQVWLLSQEDYDNICAINDDDWKENWGWWRYCSGSNVGSANHEYIIHGEKIMAWDGLERKEFIKECSECSDYYLNCKTPRKPTDVCFANGEDIAQCLFPREYSDLLTYFCEEIGASTEKNVCALAVDLAKQNNLTLAELFKKYLG